MQSIGQRCQGMSHVATQTARILMSHEHHLSHEDVSTPSNSLAKKSLQQPVTHLNIIVPTS
jgi:hypothetical protein